MIGDPFYDKTVLVLNGDSFTDLSIKKNKVDAVGGAYISATIHGADTPTGSAIRCGTTANGTNINSVYVRGGTIDDLGADDCTIEIAAYITSFNSVFSTLLEWGHRDTSIYETNSFDIGVSQGSIALESVTGTVVRQLPFVSGDANYFNNHWRYLTLIKENSIVKLFEGATLLATFSGADAAAPMTNTTYKHLTLGSSSTAGSYNFGGCDVYIGCLRITRAARPDPTTAKFPVFPTYAGQISGTISGVTGVDSWTVKGVSTSGLSCSTTTFNGAYTLNCPSLEPYTLTAELTVNGVWRPSKDIPIGYLVVATNPDANPLIYKCTSGGTTGTTEPAFTDTTITDGSVTWVKQKSAVDPAALGLKIPT